MLRIVSWAALLLSSLQSLPPLTEPPHDKQICGTVLDENSLPAAQVLVAAFPEFSFSGPVYSSRTDQQGQYCVAHLSSGEYRMTASDSEKGYPDMDATFFAATRWGTSVTLTDAQPKAQSDFRIPYKAAFLHVHLVDAQTHKPLQFASFHFALRSNEARSMSGGASPEDVHLLPPGEDIYLNFDAPGYRAAPGDGSKGILVNLLPGSSKTLTLALTPADPPTGPLYTPAHTPPNPPPAAP